VSIEREPGGDYGCHDHEETQIPHFDVEIFEVRDLCFAGLLALFVLVERRRSEGLHRGIIVQLEA
jgi:hypothetical protein